MEKEIFDLIEDVCIKNQLSMLKLLINRFNVRIEGKFLIYLYHEHNISYNIINYLLSLENYDMITLNKLWKKSNKNNNFNISHLILCKILIYKNTNIIN